MTDYPTVWLAEDGHVFHEGVYRNERALVLHPHPLDKAEPWHPADVERRYGPLRECRVVPVDVLRRIATLVDSAHDGTNHAYDEPVQEAHDSLSDCLAILDTLTGDDDE